MASSTAVTGAWASAPGEPVIDAVALADLELRAASAEPRERCYLYTELLHNWTELAGRAVAAGDEEAARAAVGHADKDAEKLKAALGRDSKRLKNAEQSLQRSVYRLSDIMRVTSAEERDVVQAVLKHVSSVHDDLLAAVFAH